MNGVAGGEAVMFFVALIASFVRASSTRSCMGLCRGY
jgi:hypothetical protein